MAGNTTALSALDRFYYYALSFLKVGVFIFVLRMITAIFFANLLGLEWTIVYLYDVVPQFLVATDSLLNYEVMNTLSLLVTVLGVFVLFYTAYARGPQPKQAFAQKAYWDVLYLGLFFNIIQLLVVVVSSARFTVQGNWYIAVPVLVLLLVSVNSFVVRRNLLVDFRPVRAKRVSVKKKSVAKKSVKKSSKKKPVAKTKKAAKATTKTKTTTKKVAKKSVTKKTVAAKKTKKKKSNTTKKGKKA